MIPMPALSYASAALAYFLLVLLLSTKWRKSGNFWLTTACMVTAVWASVMAVQAMHAVSHTPLTIILELMRDGSWFCFLLLKSNNAQRTPSRVIVVGIAGIVAISAYAALYVYWNRVELSSLTFFINIGAFLLLAIAGLSMIEMILRQATDADKWGIKFACLGIAGMFAYDFYLYSEMLLFQQVNTNIWGARGWITMLAMPLIGISASRQANWGKALVLSRGVLFNSVTVLGCSFYLLMMAAAGYYIRYFGGNWGAVIQAVFFSGAVLLLAVVMLSGSFRAHLKVFLSKHFFRYGYDYREEWIRFTRSLTDQNHQPYEQAIHAIAQLVESTGGALWIKREQDQFEPAARWNFHSPEHSEHGHGQFCVFLSQNHWIIDLAECRLHPEVYPGLDLPPWLESMTKAWIVVPLILHRQLFGFMVLAHPRSAIRLNWEVRDLLKIAGSQAASYLAQAETANALLIARQFDSYNRMSTFIVHDLKNLVSQLSLLLANAEKHKNRPEFQQDMVDTVHNSVEKMTSLLKRFHRSSSPDTFASVYLDQLIEKIVAFKSSRIPRPCVAHLEKGICVYANQARLERVLSHFLDNAIEATPDQGTVSVSLEREGEWAKVTCTDSGHGMTPEFIRERLFKPFESTKSSGMGIGVFEAKEYVNELGGSVCVMSEVNSGTTFVIRLPLENADEKTNLEAA